jgi:hypothetical protein
MKNTIQAIKELTTKEKLLLLSVIALFVLFTYVDGTYGIQ